MTKDNIPKHWQVKKLGEVCDKITKGGTPTTYGFSFVTKGINFIKIENIKFGKVDLLSIKNFITEAAHTYQKKSILGENDLLFSIAGTIGETCLIKKDYLPANTNQALAILRGYDKFLLPQFLTYQLNSSISQYVKSKARGGAMNNISLEDLKDIDIVIPPLPDQLGIVSKIEELLSDFENGKQQLLTAQQQLKVYRQSLLKAAFEGKLTKNKGKWENLKLGDVANAVDPQPSHRTPPISVDGIPFVSIKDLDSKTDKIDLNNARKVSNEVLKEHLERYKLDTGDFVIGKIGTIGKPVRIALPQNYTLSANVVLIQPRKVDATYLYYFFQSSIIQKAFTAGMKATTQAAFGIQKVRELRIELPAILEQQHIVNELESKLTICDKIEETISQSLLQAETLKQSILKKAFEGKLIY